jgi:hypothetical protein
VYQQVLAGNRPIRACPFAAFLSQFDPATPHVALSTEPAEADLAGGPDACPCRLSAGPKPGALIVNASAAWREPPAHGRVRRGTTPLEKNPATGPAAGQAKHPNCRNQPPPQAFIYGRVREVCRVAPDYCPLWLLDRPKRRALCDPLVQASSSQVAGYAIRLGCP